MVDLAEKDVSFEIMAWSMSENKFEYRPVQNHDVADNDDQKNRHRVDNPDSSYLVPNACAGVSET